MKLSLVFLILCINAFCFADHEARYEIIALDFNNKLPFISLQVEQEKVSLLLDTGARNQVLVLDKTILAKLTSLAEFPIKFRSTDITGKKYFAKKYILPQFNIGKITFSKVRIEEDTKWGLSTSSASELSNKNGAVGLELFTNKAIILDYPNNKLVIMNGKVPADYDMDHWQVLDFKIDRFGISVYADIDGTTSKKFILDSGSNISIIKPSSIGKNKTLDDCTAILSPGKKCTYINSKNFIIKKIDYGEIFFYLYDFTDLQADGILGHNFLVNKIIYIDFDKRIMKMKSV